MLRKKMMVRVLESKIPDSMAMTTIMKEEAMEYSIQRA